MKANIHVLAQCEREQLHLSGAIQPHGTLLVADANGTIAHAAQNAEEYLGTPAADWLGKPLPGPLATLAQSVAAAAGSRRWTLLSPTPSSGSMQALVTRGPQGSIIAELVPQQPDAASEAAAWAQRSATPRTPDEMAADEAAVTQRVAQLTGFQRVMYYRFREDGDGEVIAEERRDESYGSYLGLRFPASDIPQVARALYLKNPWRMIPNAPAASVPVVGRAADAATQSLPDLTYSDLRSVSPVHQAYLSNMGVVASLSFPVVKRAELVGLIAAHHSQAQTLPFAVLEQCSALVSRHAETAVTYELQQTLRRQDVIAQHVQRLRPLVSTFDDIEHNWDELGEQLQEMFQADGVRLHHDDVQLKQGLCGSDADRAPLDQWFNHSDGAGVKFSENIRRSLYEKPSDDIAGALGIDLSSRAGKLRLYLTRGEHVHEVAWGGNPDKPVESIGALPIAPRVSFEKWVEKRFGYCRPWTTEERHLALALRVLLLQALRHS